MSTTDSLRPQMFEIEPDEIGALVARFYARIREHEILGPVFGNSVENWPEHEKKIAAFWRGAILREPGYSGNPMQVHLANPDVKAEHFPIWLQLFRETAEEVLCPEKAASFAHLADRIGKGLSFGIENFRRPAGSPPVLV